MSWATEHISKLIKGHTVQFRPHGRSMEPLIYSGWLVTVVPLKGVKPTVDDIVLCNVEGAHYLHLVRRVDGDRFEIGNNRGGVNGWTHLRNIFGRCVEAMP